MPSIFGINSTISSWSPAEIRKRINQSRAATAIDLTTTPTQDSTSSHRTSTIQEPSSQSRPVQPSIEKMPRTSMSTPSELTEVTLSPPPADVKAGTPSVASEHESPASKTQRGRLRTAAELKTLRKTIMEVLQTDTNAIRGVVKNAPKQTKWHLWSEEERQAHTKDLVAAKIDERIAMGLHASCKYTRFKGFVPSLKPGRDYGKLRLVDEQLEDLKYMTVGETAREEKERKARAREEDDDEEDLGSLAKGEQRDASPSPATTATLRGRKRSLSKAKDRTKRRKVSAVPSTQHRVKTSIETADHGIPSGIQPAIGEAFVRGTGLYDGPTADQGDITDANSVGSAFLRGLRAGRKLEIAGMEWVCLRGWVPMYAMNKQPQDATDDQLNVEAKRAKAELLDW